MWDCLRRLLDAGFSVLQLIKSFECPDVWLKCTEIIHCAATSVGKLILPVIHYADSLTLILAVSVPVVLEAPQMSGWEHRVQQQQSESSQGNDHLIPMPFYVESTA